MKFEETNSVCEASGFKVATVIRVYEHDATTLETVITDDRGNILEVVGWSHTDGATGPGLFSVAIGDQEQGGEKGDRRHSGISDESVRSIDWCDPTDAEKARIELSEELFGAAYGACSA